ncbi:MAG TPA: aldose epimerase family protein [Bacilli bacterium]|nr:aldose epimerase family protein [Bacilli bacterium]
MKIDIVPLNIDKAVLCTLQNDHGLKLTLTNFGAAIVSLYAPDRAGTSENVTLTYANLDDFFHSTQFFGKTVGRTAGRIPNSIIKIGHETYALESAFGRHTLHGGVHSFAFKLFTFKLLEFGEKTTVQFRYISPFGEGGFPGQARIDVFYTLFENRNEVLIEYEATTDFPTPINLTNHTYFNLSGFAKRDVLDHELQMNTPLFFEIDEELILTQQMPVNRVMDFRKPKQIGEDIEDEKLQRSKAFGYDHTFKTNGDDLAVVLSDATSGRRLKMFANYPAVNIYTDNYHSGKILDQGQSDRRYSGIAIEPEFVPIELDTYILQPEDTYRRHIKLVFDITDK